MKAILVAGLLTAIASQAAMGQTAAPAPAPGQTATPPGTTAPAAPAAPAARHPPLRHRLHLPPPLRHRLHLPPLRHRLHLLPPLRHRQHRLSPRPARPTSARSPSPSSRRRLLHLPGLQRPRRRRQPCSGCRPCAAIELGFGPGCPTETGNRGWIGPADRRAERSGGGEPQNSATAGHPGVRPECAADFRNSGTDTSGAAEHAEALRAEA